MPHSFSVRLEPDDACWIRAPAAVMAVHESNFHAPCCEACGKEWGKTVPTAESDPIVTVLTELHVHGAHIAHTVQTDCAESSVKGDRQRTSTGHSSQLLNRYSWTRSTDPKRGKAGLPPWLARENDSFLC